MEPTVTRAALRRAIGAELQMPFYRRFPSGYSSLDGASTASKGVDAALRQQDKFWNGSWYFGITTGDVSLIRSFSALDRSFALEVERTASGVEDFELLSVWNSIEVHAAINRAIGAAGRIFFQTTVDQTLILQEDVLEYSIASLSVLPWRLNKVFIERSNSVQRGMVSSATSATIVVPFTLSGITTSFKVSIYDGTGKGQIRSVSSGVGSTVTVSSAWTTTPDATSRFALWDASEETNPWEPVHVISQDAKEFPDVLRIGSLFPSSYGMRIRLEYLSLPPNLTGESSTTVVPADYIVPKACSLLHGQRLGNTRADQNIHYAESNRYKEQAEEFLVRFSPHVPDTQIPVTEIGSSIRTDDPLNWRMQ